MTLKTSRLKRKVRRDQRCRTWMLDTVSHYLNVIHSLPIFGRQVIVPSFQRQSVMDLDRVRVDTRGWVSDQNRQFLRQITPVTPS